MLYTALINASPDYPDSHRNALIHCRSLIDHGNQIRQVFFMHAATQMAVHPDALQWSRFAEEYQIDLQTCISTAADHALDVEDYQSGFLQGGLSSLADSILSSDVVLQLDRGGEQLDAAPVLDKKNIVFVFSNPPKKASFAAEGVDLLLVLSAFEANISVVFMGGGVQNLYQDDSQPRYVKRFRALPDFDISECYIVSDSGKDYQEVCKQSSLACARLSHQSFIELTQQVHTLHF